MTIVRSPQAEEDAWSVWSYIVAHDEAAADRFLHMVDDKLRLLEQYPELGRERSELGIALRSLTAEACLLFYRPIEDGIELVRVLHGARDLAAIDFG